MDTLALSPSVGTPLMWACFIAVILVLLIADLVLFHPAGHETSSRGAFLWCVFWVVLALLFNLGIYYWLSPQAALEFLTGYVIEYSLSVDNIFVFLVLFSYFSVPPKWQHRVLFYGILGAIVMRGIFILVGTELLRHFGWAIYLFGAILVISGIKLMRHSDEGMDPSGNPVIRLFKKLLPMSESYNGENFFVRQGGKLLVTPLFLVLVSLELTDVVFAIDSVPAIFAITLDPFIVFTSNIFAILGLRSMYLLLSASMRSLHYLKYGLSIVLMFVGLKMLISGWFKIPTGISLVFIAAVIGLSVLASIFYPPKKREATILKIDDADIKRPTPDV